MTPRRVIRSWITSTTTPAHNKGEITRSRVSDWSHVPRGYDFPEPIRESDVVIIVGGWDGTHYAASWARLADKPIVPVATFGLAARDILTDEQVHFERPYSTRLSSDDYETLNRVLPDPITPESVETLAKDVVALAERLIGSRDVFIIMSFAEKAHLQDA